MLILYPPFRVGEGKATACNSGFFFAWFMNLILDLLGSLNEGKCKINAFSYSQEALLNEKSLIEFAPLPYPLKFTF
jgi:hypothetical protein